MKYSSWSVHTSQNRITILPLIIPPGTDQYSAKEIENVGARHTDEIHINPDH